MKKHIALLASFFCASLCNAEPIVECYIGGHNLADASYQLVIKATGEESTIGTKNPLKKIRQITQTCEGVSWNLSRTGFAVKSGEITDPSVQQTRVLYDSLGEFEKMEATASRQDCRVDWKKYVGAPATFHFTVKQQGGARETAINKTLHVQNKEILDGMHTSQQASFRIASEADASYYVDITCKLVEGEIK